MPTKSTSGQIAMQYLFTYGFAIVIASAAIGAMSYFNVLHPSVLLPERCSFQVSVNCVDFEIQPNQLSIILQNSANRGMIVRDVSVSSDALGKGSGGEDCSLAPAAQDIIFRINQKTRFDMVEEFPTGACTFRDTGRYKNKYNITLHYSWADSQKINHRISGELYVANP